MTMQFKIEDFGNGFRAFCYGRKGVGNRPFTIGALVSRDHVLSKVPYFVAAGVHDFVDGSGRRLYDAVLLSTLMNGSLDYGPKDEVFRAYDRSFFKSTMGMTENDFLWERTVHGDSLEDVLEFFWPDIEAEAKALASITREEILSQAVQTGADLNREREVFPEASEMDWIVALRKSEALHAAELKAREDRIRYLEDRVVELKGRI